MTNKLGKLPFKGKVYGVKMLETKRKRLGTCEDDNGTACRKLLSFKTCYLIFLLRISDFESVFRILQLILLDHVVEQEYFQLTMHLYT